MMYTLVALFVGARVIDFVQEGAYAARGAFIISEAQDEIATKITEEMDRGVTVFKGYGHFTKSDREILYCVVGRNEIVRLKNIITQSIRMPLFHSPMYTTLWVKALRWMNKNGRLNGRLKRVINNAQVDYLLSKYRIPFEPLTLEDAFQFTARHRAVKCTYLHCFAYFTL